MQRVKRKENKFIKNTNNFKHEQEYLFNNNIPNGNNNKIMKRNSFNNNEISPNHSNKFLSIPERQKIIQEINKSKNQLNLYHPPEDNDIVEVNQIEENKNLLYIKKTKSNLNFLEKPKKNSGNLNFRNINNNIENNRLKFSDNKNLINNTIKEYYNKKNENPFKTYLKTINNDLNENKTKNNQKAQYLNTDIISNNNSQIKSRNENKKFKKVKERNIASNDIYKKPISSKIYNKPNTKAKNITEEKNNFKNKNINRSPNNIDLKKLYITNSTRKEKINCTKMIKNNGVKKNIFNILNNYNTKTIQNYSIKDSDKINYNKQKTNNNNKDFIGKYNSSLNFKIKNNANNNSVSNNKNININNNKDFLLKKCNNLNQNIATEYNFKNKSTKNNKSLNSIKPAFLNAEINNNFLATNDFYKIDNEEFNKNKSPKMFYSNSNNNLYLKYTKKNIHSPTSTSGILPKKRINRNTFMSNDLPRLLVEKDLLSFATLNALDEKTNNNGKLNQKYNEQLKLPLYKENNDLNNNFFSEKEFLSGREHDNYAENRINSFINTEVKRNSRNKSLSLSLLQSSKKELKRNRSFSYLSNKDDETSDNYIYQNGKNNFKYQNGKSISPFYTKNYYYNNQKNSLITKEIRFPFSIKRNNSYYNSDDDIMNSNNNSKIGSYNDSNNAIKEFNYNNSFDNLINNIVVNNKNNYKLYSKSNTNILNINHSPSPSKDYYFNYLSNKINNDFLNEKKFNKIDKNIYNSEYLTKKSFCEKCKRNYCPYCCRLSPEFDINDNNFINKKITPVKYLNANYYPSTINSRSINMNYENNILKNNFIRNNKERYKEEEEDNNINKNIITKNVDLKLDVSNGKHSSELNQNINNNVLDGGSFNSVKIEPIEIDNSKINIQKPEENKYEQDEKNNNEKEKNKDINDIKDKEINIESEIKTKKDNEMDKTEQIRSFSEITSSDRFLIKGEINLSNSEFISNENNNNENTNKKNVKFNDLSKDNEEKENKTYKKIDMQNIQVTPPTKRNSFIKDISINNNDNNFTKTDIDSNINNTNTGIIIKNFAIKDDLSKKNYINSKYQSESPILSDILEYLNIICPKNYFIIKDKIVNLFINNNEENNPILFANILYQIAKNQKKFQPLYAKLCKDIDKHHNKKDKSKSILRTQLMKLCKSNFKKIKTFLENIVYIENDINFIGELINAQMVSKKVGQQCLTHLLNKFNQYNNDENLKNKKDEKYLYLNCNINLVNQFATCINYYQKNKIRQEDLLQFQKDINQNIKILKEIYDNTINEDMPINIKNKLLKLINKSKNNWELTIFEKSRNEFLKLIYEEPNINNINNNNIYSTIYKFENNNNNNKILSNNNHKQIKSVSPSNSNMINIKKKSNLNNKNQKIESKKNENNKNINNFQKICEYSKIIRDNLILFKNHIDEKNTSDNFKNWEEIDNLFLNKKIPKYEIFKSIIEASKNFIDDKNNIYYLDIYIKVILEYYYNYFKKKDINEIKNTIFEELNNLSNEEINKEENKNIKDLWIVIIYYLLENKIMSMNDFDYFCKENNKEIKNNIYTILNDMCAYNKDNKDFYLKELKNTKFYNSK